mmetsp:Transcript_81845/g.144454  ORF Transcript_81845/g.144454 Transcript_81845/m.144454 type:complete len:255 (+) Transcript_81845:388-1152(+)
MLLTAKVLHRFVVENPIHCMLCRLPFHLVHAAPEITAPDGHLCSEEHVDHHRRERNRRILRPDAVPEHPRDHTQLQQSGEHVEEDHRQHGADPLGPPLDDIRQGPCLAIQMEVEVQAVDVGVHLRCDLPEGRLGDLNEDCIAQLAAAASKEAHCTIQNHNIGGPHPQERNRAPCREAINNCLEEVRHRYIEDFGKYEQRHCRHHTRPQPWLPHRPNVGRDSLHNGPDGHCLRLSLGLLWRGCGLSWRFQRGLGG